MRGVAVCVFAAMAPAAGELVGGVTLVPARASVRVGATIAVTAYGSGLSEPGLTFEWQASEGDISGTGSSAAFTAPEEPGWAVISLVLREGEIAAPTRYAALLVYRQFVILKADDFVSWDGTVNEGWEDYLDYMNRVRRLKSSVGIITICLESFPGPQAHGFTEAVKAIRESGFVEFWHHGYDHVGDTSPEPEWTEFYNTPYAYQKAHLEDGLALARSVLGFPMTAFGPPFGMSDAITTQVVDESEDILVWMDGRPESTKLVLEFIGTGPLEHPVGVPNWEHFQAAHDPVPFYEVLQLHPGYEDPEGSLVFLEHFDVFIQILDFLDQEQVTFIQPTEVYRLAFGGRFPLHPDEDADGDGVSDLTEGQGDADFDGLPDFLDADQNGQYGPVISNVRITPLAPGFLTLVYDLAYGYGGDVCVAVHLSTDGGAAFPFPLTEVTGDIGGGVVPGANRSILWDVGVDYPGVEAPGAALEFSLEDCGPKEEGLESVAAGSFERGSPDCTREEECPVHEVTLGAYAIGTYEVTNADYAAVLDWALGQGCLNNEGGGPYAGGNVSAYGQRLVDLAYPGSGLAFDGEAFTPTVRAPDIAMDHHPVVLVSWYGAVAYCVWRSEMEGLSPAYDIAGGWRLRFPYANGYRLPTEAEWERAAAWEPEPGPGHWCYATASHSLSTDRANFAGANPLGLLEPPCTTPVGFYSGEGETLDSPSPIGAYDMSGNVWEWCHDRFGDYPESTQANPRGGVFGVTRVIRGGSWADAAADCRTARRGADYATFTSVELGFRVARVVWNVEPAVAGFRLDTIAPCVDCFDLAGTPAPNEEQLTFQVTFSEPVIDVAASDFELIVTGRVDEAPAIVEVTGSGAGWEVTVSTGVVEGVLTLWLADEDASIHDASLNPLAAEPNANHSHVLDTIAPEALDITSESGSPTNADTILFEVEFNEPVTGFLEGGPPPLSVNAPGLSYTDIQTGLAGVTGQRYLVRFEGLAGSGDLGFTLSPAAIADAAGNTLAGSVTDSPVLQIDRIAPICRCRDITVTLTEAGQATLVPADVDDGCEDDTGIAEMRIDRTQVSCADLGAPAPIFLEAEDTVGNVASCVALVTVTDPENACPRIAAHELMGAYDAVDADADGRLAAGEVMDALPGLAPSVFADMDSNSDDRLTVAELLATGATPLIHSADQDGDRRISMSELLRAVQLYNSAGHHCANTPGVSEDGYRPGPGAAHACRPHASDYVGPDWFIELSELLRLIQLHNAAGYAPCTPPCSEDSFLPTF